MIPSRLLVIGAGRMAEAIVSGLKSTNEPFFSAITIANRSDRQRLDKLASTYKVEITRNWKESMSSFDVVLLAAPPDAHDNLFSELSSCMNGQLVITVAAGIDPSTMEAHLPAGAPVCWIMPNTAALVGKSMTTFACGKNVKQSHRHVIEQILIAIGEYEELSEDQVHDLTAITGSAPAFLYLFSEALEEAAVNYGVTREQAQRLVTKMIAGSASMLETGASAETLRNQVTTPGGSTAAGVEVLESNNMKNIMKEAVKATNRHARGK
ncbi:pyrroline-5-carboxylate reductase [Alkalihalobacillus sp. TS-13]|uniref:pyrroline-5-carboxylate reductase n=1 Tax=Alkalihalobacillus sp. TS-13 TaxID=2842455 RepID=UPI001C877381|nr:pyrroline-5-carboxylate reductase [Alkalihalobacillus sp. TS-13]